MLIIGILSLNSATSCSAVLNYERTVCGYNEHFLCCNQDLHITIQGNSNQPCSLRSDFRIGFIHLCNSAWAGWVCLQWRCLRLSSNQNQHCKRPRASRGGLSWVHSPSLVKCHRRSAWTGCIVYRRSVLCSDGLLDEMQITGLALGYR